ncbi:MAG: hypothetical protein J6Z35_11350 [Lachnospiraceae bacterium]|nr:hypothetical protein [Lachnospiraceae bacterium]
MEQQKILVDEQTVRNICRSDKTRFLIVTIILAVVGVLALIVIPAPENIIGAVICFGIMLLVIFLRAKKGDMQVYFKKKAVTDKKVWETPETSDEDASVTFYLVFDDHSHPVPESKYNRTEIGDLFYVLYNAKNGRIVEIYDAKDHELAPTLDIRM